PKRRKMARCKWVYKTKYADDGFIDKYTTHLLVNGFSQVEGIDYPENFVPIAKMDSLHLVLFIVASQGFPVYHMDVNNAFLHGDIQEEIYMEQPAGFVQDSSFVCQLRRSLYGLKQSPRAWYEKMDSFLLSTSFFHFHSDHTVYLQHIGEDIMILVLYVDDMLLYGSFFSHIRSIQRALSTQFDMTDLGLLHYFLGLQISQTDSGIDLIQQNYTHDLLQCFDMANYKTSPSPFQSG
ncbi:hypothetical protein KI387_013608, partial [Taxus chinensis]